MSYLLPELITPNAKLFFLGVLVMQGLLFILCYRLLKHFLFKPGQQLLNNRISLIEEMEKKASKLKESNAILIEEYDWRMEGAYLLAKERKDVSEIIARKRSDMIMKEARNISTQDIKNVISETKSACTAIEPLMITRVSEFSENITNKLINN